MKLRPLMLLLIAAAWSAGCEGRNRTDPEPDATATPPPSESAPREPARRSPDPTEGGPLQ